MQYKQGYEAGTTIVAGVVNVGSLSQFHKQDPSTKKGYFPKREGPGVNEQRFFKRGGELFKPSH